MIDGKMAGSGCVYDFANTALVGRNLGALRFRSTTGDIRWIS